MRNSSFRLFAVSTTVAASLLTGSPSWAAPTSGTPTTPTQSQTDAMDKYEQQRISSGDQTTNGATNSTSPRGGKAAAKAAPAAPAKPVGKADMAGNTALHAAAYQGDTAKLTELLDKKGAVVDVPEKRGFTPLMLAAGNNHPEAVKLLIERGANVNYKNKEGMTALHKAAADGDLATVDILLKAGADPNATDTQGRTPLQLSERNRQKDWSDVSDHLKAASAAK